MNESTLLIGGGILATIGAAWWLSKRQGTPLPDPGSTPTKNAFIAPSDLLARMNQAYLAKRAANGYRDVTGRDQWISWMQDGVFHLPYQVWGYMYDHGIGFSLANGGAYAGESQQEAWLNYAANEPSLQR